jgi:hypothetical protein
LTGCRITQSSSIALAWYGPRRPPLVLAGLIE